MTFAILDPVLPTVGVNVSVDNRESLWAKTKLGFEYVYDNYM